MHTSVRASQITTQEHLHVYICDLTKRVLEQRCKAIPTSQNFKRFLLLALIITTTSHHTHQHFNLYLRVHIMLTFETDQTK